MRVTALACGLALAALASVACGRGGGDSRSHGEAASAGTGDTSSAGRAATTTDPCALLKIDEIQALAPNAQISKGASSTLRESARSVVCEYTWGAGNNAQSGLYQLQIALSDASWLFPGMDAETIKEGILAETKAGGSDAAAIPGVGDAAVFKSDSPMRASTTAYVKGSLLELDLEGVDARAYKDQVIALLKSAVARL